jgi:hypothetical protein
MLFVTFYLPRAVKPFCIADRAVSCLTRAVPQMIRDWQRKPYSTAHGTPTTCLPSTVFAGRYWKLQWFANGVGFAGKRFGSLEVLAMITSVEDRPC